MLVLSSSFRECPTLAAHSSPATPSPTVATIAKLVDALGRSL